MKNFVIIITLLLLTTSPALSSEYVYSELESESLNGKYSATVRLGVQKQYPEATPVITVIDNTLKTPLWSITLNKDSEIYWPTEITVTNNGYLIARSFEFYFIFDINGSYKQVKNQNLTEFFNAKRIIPDDELRKYRHCTTVMCWWSMYSTNGVVDRENKSFFFKRLYWGRTYLIDIKEAKLINDAELEKMSESFLIKNTSQVIEKFKNNYLQSPKRMKRELLPCLFVAKTLNLGEGQFLLNQFHEIPNNYDKLAIKLLGRIQTTEVP